MELACTLESSCRFGSFVRPYMERAAEYRRLVLEEMHKEPIEKRPKISVNWSNLALGHSWDEQPEDFNRVSVGFEYGRLDLWVAAAEGSRRPSYCHSDSTELTIILH